jgi:hypothetical protein
MKSASTIVNPFPNNSTSKETNLHPAGFERLGKLPTPDYLKKSVLFGIPMKSAMTGQELSDEVLSTYISEAISEIEHELNMFITPTEFEERHDYSQKHFTQHWGYVRLQNTPILQVSMFAFTYHNEREVTSSNNFVNIPLEFLSIRPQDGTIEITPTTGMSTTIFIQSFFTGYQWAAVRGVGNDFWPNCLLIRYSAGFKEGEIPQMLTSLIGNLAGYKVLSSLGPILFPYNSVSIGVAGLSQSTGNAGTNFLAARLDDLGKKIEQQKQIAKGYYLKNLVIDYL